MSSTVVVKVSGSASVREYMTAAPYTVPPTMPIQVAAQFMTSRRIRHLPVVDDKRLVGMLSSSHVAPAALKAHVVHEVMHPEPFVVPIESSLREVVQLMMTGRHEAVVVSSGGRPQGIFTLVDALKVLHTILQ